MLTATELLTHADDPASPAPSIAEVYDTHVDFVVRMARGLGVPASAVDDVVQDVFVVVHRRLPEFEGRARLKTWIARIVLNVVRAHRRAAAKTRAMHPIDEEDVLDPAGKTPQDLALEREALRILKEILDSMPEEQRVIFALSEIEGLEMAEVAASLEINVNTAYSRLRLARQTYERGVARARARDQWRET